MKQFFFCIKVHISSTRVVIWTSLNTIAIILIQLAVLTRFSEYFEYSLLVVILATGIGEIVFLSLAASFEK